MAEFEQKYIYPLIKDKLILFLCYDDIFMVWTKSKEPLKDFMNELNQKHPSLKFEYKFDCKRIEFLDTLLSIYQQNKLWNALLRKSSNRQNFLMYNRNICTHFPESSTSNSTNMFNIPRLTLSL